MWNEADIDHVNIQSTVYELDGSDSVESGLLAYSTSFVDVNGKRPGETAVFQCELYVRLDRSGFRVKQAVVVTQGMWDGEVVWAHSYEYFLGPDFKPTVKGYDVDELARCTINAYGRRLYCEKNGVVYHS